jgi:hypothetical protein
MQLEAEAYIRQQPPGIRAVIDAACKEMSLDEIRKAFTAKAANRRDALICELECLLGLDLKTIASITDVEPQYAKFVLQRRREDEVRIRGMRWGA